MSVYTKTGDDGTTGLYTGERMDKDSLRVEAYGSVDEADSALGLARALATKDEVQQAVESMQKKLYLLMADLASLHKEPMIQQTDVDAMEQAMDALENRLPKLTAFLVPGKTASGASLDLARTAVRRAERRVLALAKVEKVHVEDRIFLNRLSDYCFLLMRLEEFESAEPSRG